MRESSIHKYTNLNIGKSVHSTDFVHEVLATVSLKNTNLNNNMKKTRMRHIVQVNIDFSEK